MTSSQLKAIRTQAGMTQQQLADYCQVHLGTIAAWEQGRQEIPGPARVLVGMLAKKSEA